MRWARLSVALFFACLCLPALGDTPRTTVRLQVQESYVAGYRYHEGKKVWKDLSVGDALELIREPDNPYDSRAVRVDWRGHKLGYVPRLDNEGVSRQLDFGVPLQARIQRLKKSRSPRQRIIMEIYLGVETGSSNQRIDITLQPELQ